MIGKAKYKIVHNVNNRRILVIDGILDIDNHNELKADDFDAIFLETVYENEVKNYLAITCVHPIIHVKCWFKPTFLSNSFQNKVGTVKETLDGFAAHPLEVTVTERIEDIYERITHYKLHMLPIDIHDEEYLMRQLRYMISRGWMELKMVVSNGASTGYASIFSSLFARQNYITQAQRDFFIQRLLELGYIRKTRFVNRVHLCPDCLHSHLLFIETCPHCHSSNIQEELVLHHFRCANISPEHTYLYDGELRCPKCKHFLQHIGVDYDRPANVYTCKACSQQFTRPEMKVKCANGGREYSPSQLVPFDVYNYEFTPKGVEAFTSDDANIMIKAKFQTGYCSLDDFISTLQLFMKTPKEIKNSVEQLAIGGSIWVTETEKTDFKFNLESDIMQYIHADFENCRFAIDGKQIHFVQIVPADIADKREEKMKKKLAGICQKIESLYGNKLQPHFKTEKISRYEMKSFLEKECKNYPPRILNNIK